MEITQADLRIGDYTTLSITDNFQDENYEIETTEANDVCYILDVRQQRNFRCSEISSRANDSSYSGISASVEPNLNSIQQLAAGDSGDIKRESIYQDSLDSESVDEEIDSRRNSRVNEICEKNEEQVESYSISTTVVIPNDILEELSFGIKKEKSSFESKWFRTADNPNLGGNRLICKLEQRSRLSVEEEENNLLENERSSKTKGRLKGVKSRQEDRVRLRKKADCMREKRKKLYEEESEEQRLERLAREAAKRREMRMYYETPEQRRKRLDSEAARKREYRMYNETPDERRKRLDREAERRRVKRLTMYASETPEQRRDRLNRESAKRREARVNQYAKETEQQRQERLQKDALRAREMRFTRSAIETEEERRQRLVKDALRKRELRMHGGNNVNHLTELQTVRNFQELNNLQMTTKDDHDNQFSGHYLGNWMMWFQNTITPNANSGDKNDGNENQRETRV